MCFTKYLLRSVLLLLKVVNSSENTGLFAVSSMAATQLTQKQAEELVLNVPRAVASKARGGCPKTSLLWVNHKQSTIFFAIHNPCDKSGAVSDKIGNFTVDLKNGDVWIDVDRADDGRNLIDSPVP